MKKQHTYIYIVLAMMILPAIACAQRVYFKTYSESPQSHIIELRSDPEGANSNVVDGVIDVLGDGVEIRINTDESVLTLWPTAPSYNNQTKSIYFVGGTPLGFSKDSLLFRMTVSSDVVGNIKLKYHDGSIYLNDGKGTKMPLEGISTDIVLTRSGFNIISVMIMLLFVFIFLLGFYVYRTFKSK